jgi:hypothetical protein
MKAARATGGKSGGAAPSFSTSQGRANFARALVTTDQEKTVVGFDRYNRPVAALVPIEAVAMLAGQSGEVDPAVRAKIVRMARLFLAVMPAKKKVARRFPTARRAKAKAAKKKSAKRAKTKARPSRRKGLGNGA